MPRVTHLPIPRWSGFKMQSMRAPRKRLVPAALFLIVAGAFAWYLVNRQQSYAETHYTKREFRIPMRDGVKLFTQVYIPKDASRSYPFLITRTPFGVTPYGERNFRRLPGPSESFDRSGYIFVFQDVRGRYQSEGNFVDMRPHIESPASGQTDESTDTHDSIEWLLRNVPGNNGSAGIWGMSYPGFYAASSIIDSHPAIKAASPEAPIADLFRGDDAYHNGAFMLAQQFLLYSNFFWLRSGGPDMPPANLGRAFDYGTSDGYAFFLKHGPALSNFNALIHNAIFRQNIEHDTYDDYWGVRNNSQYLKNIHCPVLVVGGWFDAEDLAGTFGTYDAISRQNPNIQTSLVMGPWGHGDWLRTQGKALGPMDFQEPTGVYFRDQIAFDFFEHYLKGGPAAELPRVRVFQTGTNRWINENAWPPANAVKKSLYLHANRKLSFDPPAAGEQAFDEYVSNPKSPVPYLEHTPTDLGSEFMYGDQRFAAGRSDVITYLSEPLQEDLTIAGPISPHLRVSTSGTDSDFDVKLIDVYPEQGSSAGYQQLVRGEPMRGKFRNSLSQPEAMVPGKITEVGFQMPDIDHTFRRGHRVMVQIQSSWFPLTDLNPQTFVDTARATAADFVKATERIYHAPDSASEIQILVQH
jgi:putative CocE/NonD family hydrolase